MCFAQLVGEWLLEVADCCSVKSVPKRLLQQNFIVALVASRLLQSPILSIRFLEFEKVWHKSKMEKVPLQIKSCTLPQTVENMNVASRWEKGNQCRSYISAYLKVTTDGPNGKRRYVTPSVSTFLLSFWCLLTNDSAVSQSDPPFFITSDLFATKEDFRN